MTIKTTSGTTPTARLALLLTVTLALLSGVVAPAHAVGSIVGHVRNASGVGQGGVTVTATSNGAVVATTTTKPDTDSDPGAFTLPLDDGTYAFTLTPPPGSEYQTTTFNSLNVIQGQPFNMVLLQGASVMVSGRLGYSEDGSFVGPSSEGDLYFTSATAGVPTTSLTTNSSGLFRATLIAGATYNIRGYMYQSPLSFSDYFTVAAPQSFNGGEYLDLAVPLSKVTVIVQDQQGNPVPGASLITVPNTTGTSQPVTVQSYGGYGGFPLTDSSGAATSWVPTGGTLGQSTLKLAGGLNVPEDLSSNYVTGDETVTLTAPRTVTVSGRLGYSEDGSFVGPSSEGDLYFTSATAGVPTTSLTTNSSGLFRATLIAGATYNIRGYMYQSPLSFSDYFTVAAPQSFNGGEYLDLAVPLSKVTVIVQDQQGNPVQGASLITVPNTTGTSQPVTVQSYGGYGGFPLTDSSGAATSWVPTGGTLGQSTLKLAGGLNVPEDLSSNYVTGDETVTLTAPRTVTVSGRLGYSEDGSFVGPSSEGDLYFTSATAGVPTTSLTTNSSGLFRATLIAGATYNIRGYMYQSPLSFSDYFTVAAPQSFNGGEYLDLAVPLSKVTVIVQDQQGNPVQGASLITVPNTTGTSQPVTVQSYGGYGGFPLTDSSGAATSWVPTGGTLGQSTLKLAGGLNVPLTLPRVDSDALIAIGYNFSTGVGTATPTPIVTLAASAGAKVGTDISLMAQAGTILAGSKPAGTMQFAYSLNGGASQPVGQAITLDGNGAAALDLPTGLPFTGNGPFNYTFTATYTPDSGSRFVGGTSAPVTVTQTAPVVLTSITVTPTTPSIVQGTPQQLTATGNYSDGSTQDLAGGVSWTSADPGTATVSSSGVVNGVAVGSTTVTAAYQGIGGSTSVSVTHLLQAITVVPDAQTIVFGQPDPTFTFTATNPAGDSLTSPPTCGVAGPHTQAGTYPITCSGGSAPYNDTISYQTGTLTVAKAAVTVTPTNQTITYGQADPSFGYTVAGLQGTDTLATPPTCGVTGAHGHAGSYPISCAGADAGPNYRVDQSATATLTVGKAVVTVTPADQSVTYGQADPTFGYAVAGLVNGDTLTTAPTCGVSSAHVHAGSYPIACGGAVATSDYTVDQAATATLTIRRATAKVTPSDQAITYGQADPAFGYAVTGLVNGDGLSTAPTCGVVGAHAHAGAYAIACSGAVASADYTLDQTATGTLTVRPASVTVTPSNQTITYGDADPVFGYTVSGLVNGDSLTAQPTCGVSEAHSAAGSYPIFCGGATAGPDYAVDQAATATLVVGKAAVVVTPAAQAISYGEPDPAFGFTVTGLRNGDTLTAQPTCGVAGAHAHAGAYVVACAGATAAANYTLDQSATSTLTVRRATVTVTPASQAITYGQSDPAFGFTVTGLRNGDALTAQPSCGASAAHTHAGSYPITCSGAAATADYTVDQSATSTLTVDKAAVTVTPAAQAITYGQPDPVFTATVAGLRNGDALTAQPTCGVAGAHSHAGSYTIACSGAAATADYTVAQTATAPLTVRAAALTVTPADQAVTYGQADPSYSYAVSGLVNGDTLTAQPSCGIAGAHVHAGSYVIACSGATASADYVVTQTATATLNVTKAVLTVTAPAVATTYGTAAGSVALNASVTGYVAGDSASSAGLGTVGCTTAATVTTGGSYAAGAYSVTCAASGTPHDYTVHITTGTLTVAKAVLTVTAANATTPYGAPIPTLSATTTGLVNGDGSGAYTGSPVLSTTATVGSHAGSYPITAAVGSLGAANYSFRFVPGTLTITKAATTLTASPARVTTGPAGLTGTLSATLTYNGGRPVVGAQVTFAVQNQTFSATTDSSGKATYTVTAAVAVQAIDNGYHASFAGTADLVASSAYASGVLMM